MDAGRSGWDHCRSHSDVFGWDDRVIVGVGVGLVSAFGGVVALDEAAFESLGSVGGVRGGDGDAVAGGFVDGDV